MKIVKNKVKLLFFKWEIIKHRPLLVYQMGKVASSSIYGSLKQCYQGMVFHTHVFDDLKETDLYLQHLYQVTKRKQLKPLVISLVREPIGRNVSAFFQNFKRETNIELSSNSQFTNDELGSLFIEKFQEHDIPKKWFDNNIKKNFEIDIFDKPFPMQGWQIYNSEKANLLVIKSEIEDSEKERAIIEFLQLPFEFKLRNFNVSEKKVYSELYRQFKTNVKFSKNYLQSQIETKYFKHFYSEKEALELIKKWSDHPVL